MDKLDKIRGHERITNFITNTPTGSVLRIREVDSEDGRVDSQNAYLAILEQHCCGVEKCHISKGPDDKSVLLFESIFEVAEVPVSNLVSAMNEVMKTTFYRLFE